MRSSTCPNKAGCGCARHAGLSRRAAFALAPPLPLSHGVQSFGPIETIMDWRRAAICTSFNSGRGIGQQHFPRSVSASKGTPLRCVCHPFIRRDPLAQYAVLDQPAIEARGCAGHTAALARTRKLASAAVFPGVLCNVRHRSQPGHTRTWISF